MPPGTFRVRGPLCLVLSIVRGNQISHARQRVGSWGPIETLSLSVSNVNVTFSLEADAL